MAQRTRSNRPLGNGRTKAMDSPLRAQLHREYLSDRHQWLRRRRSSLLELRAGSCDLTFAQLLAIYMKGVADRDTLGILEKELMPIAVQRGLNYGIPTRIHCSPKSVEHIILNRRVPRYRGGCHQFVWTMRESVPGSLASIRVSAHEPSTPIAASTSANPQVCQDLVKRVSDLPAVGFQTRTMELQQDRERYVAGPKLLTLGPRRGRAQYSVRDDSTRVKIREFLRLVKPPLLWEAKEGQVLDLTYTFNEIAECQHYRPKFDCWRYTSNFKRDWTCLARHQLQRRLKKFSLTLVHGRKPARRFLQLEEKVELRLLHTAHRSDISDKPQVNTMLPGEKVKREGRAPVSVEVTTKVLLPVYPELQYVLHM
ncbi:hypothetical protein KC367_g263 [Hortaea werneckii]|nr:hypothetical protein KC367_g263 [Hortaea werneckii]